MKTKTFALFFLVIGLSFLLIAVKASRGESGVQKPIHVPYDPFARSDRLPEYAYNKLSSMIIDRLSLLIKPAGVDLDVTIISRTPMYQRYEV
jgi:hypothetical protein